MDYLQYYQQKESMLMETTMGFKPYYKWITFNTMVFYGLNKVEAESFKPYYKWITFNTIQKAV